MTIDVPWWKAQCLVDAIIEKYKEYAEHNKVWCSEDNMLGTITKDGIITIHNIGTELTHVNGIFDVNKIRYITVLSGTGIYYRITNENCPNVSDGTIDTVSFWINNIDESNDVRIEIEYYTDAWAGTEGFYESINSNTIVNHIGDVYAVIAKIRRNGINFDLGYITQPPNANI
jgi:hypothetical protein